MPAVRRDSPCPQFPINRHCRIADSAGILLHHFVPIALRKTSALNVLQLVRSAFGSKSRDDAGAEALYASCLSKTKSYDALADRIMRQRLAPPAVCIDVGCCLGDELAKMMRAAPQGTFFAFEPLPSLFDRLQKRFKKPNVRLSNLALSDAEG